MIRIIVWIASTASPYPKNYLCSNGLYIRNDFVCDGINNCGDSSDEFSGCNVGGCGPGMFSCPDNTSRNRCLPVTARCNTTIECLDGSESDESNCPKVPAADDWSIGRNTFLCEDGLRSIEMNYTCDGECNCYDCSDESSGCLEQNENLCNTCSQPCLPTPNGPQCACHSIEDRDLNPFCQEILHCSPYTKCEQKCIRFYNKEKCLCDENYQTSRDENFNIVCNNNVSHENVLLYSTANQVKVLNLTSNIVAVVQKDINCLALTAAHNYVYCAVRRNNSAYVLKISQNSEEMFEIVKSDSRIIYSIGVDWITGNVYFTSNTSLSVCTNDGKMCTKLKSLSLGDSYHLGLAPRFGLMFWTISSRQDHEESKIFISAMDGSNERVLISEDIRYPTSLVVDELTERIFWLESDVQFFIKSVQFNGKNKKACISGLWLPWNAFAFSVFGKKTFISSRQSEIHTVENFDNKSLKHIMDKSGVSVKYLYGYNALLQRTKISNPCKKSCAGLCLLRPSSPTGLNYTCLCEHMVSNNNNTFWCKNTIDQFAESAISLIPDNPLYLFLILLIVFLAGISFHWLVQKCRPIICKRGDKCHFNVRYTRR